MTQSSDHKTDENPSRSRLPSVYVLLALTAATLGLKCEAVRDSFLGKGNEDKAALISNWPRCIQDTKVSGVDSSIVRSVRAALAIIEQHPTCEEARVFFTSGSREIILEEKERSSGWTGAAWYIPAFPNTIYLNATHYGEVRTVLENRGLPASEAEQVAAIYMVESICHEAFHAIHDGMLDRVSAKGEDKTSNLIPITLEDEVLCRVKAAAIAGEMAKVGAFSFPEVGRISFKFFLEEMADQHALKNGGIEELTARTANNYPNNPRVSAGEGGVQWHSTIGNIPLERKITEFYATATQKAVSDFNYRGPNEIAATLRISLELLLKREGRDIKEIYVAASAIQRENQKLPDCWKIDLAKVEPMLEAAARIGTVASPDEIVARFGKEEAIRTDAFLRVYPLDTARTLRFQVKDILRHAEDYSLQIPVAKRLGGIIEGELKVEDIKSFDTINAQYTMQLLSYSPEDPKVFWRMVQELFPEGARSVDRTIPSAEAMRWCQTAASSLQLEERTYEQMKKFYYSFTSAGPKYASEIRNHADNIVVLQKILKVDRRVFEAYLLRGLELSRRDEFSLDRLDCAQKVFEHHPGSARLVKQALGEHLAALENSSPDNNLAYRDHWINRFRLFVTEVERSELPPKN